MQDPVRSISGTAHDRSGEAETQGVFALSAGREVTVRPVSSADRERLGRMLDRLSPRTIYERFHAPYPRVPAWALAGMVEANHDDKEALVAVVGEEIVGHTTYVRAGNGREAEFAVVVEDGWQSKGIGRLLLTELAAKAESRGIESIAGSVLGENRRMLGVMAAVFPEMRYEIRNGTYQVRAQLRRRETRDSSAKTPLICDTESGRKDHRSSTPSGRHGYKVLFQRVAATRCRLS